MTSFVVVGWIKSQRDGSTSFSIDGGSAASGSICLYATLDLPYDHFAVHGCRANVKAALQ